MMDTFELPSTCRKRQVTVEVSLGSSGKINVSYLLRLNEEDLEWVYPEEVDVWETASLSTHYAASPRIPAGSPQYPARGPQRIRIQKLDEEERIAKNEEMQDLLEERLPLTREDQVSLNADHL